VNNYAFILQTQNLLSRGIDPKGDYFSEAAEHGGWRCEAGHARI
jgi:hypothetical protein